MSSDSFPQETLWSPADQNVLWRESAFAISWTPFFWSELSDFRWVSDQNAALLLPLDRANISQWKNKIYEKLGHSKLSLVRPNCVGKHFWSDQSALEEVMIRPKCARIRLWSDFSDQKYLWSDHLQTIVQTVVRSIFRQDPVISVWEHTGVRSIGSDHKPIWVWTSAWGDGCCLRVDWLPFYY